MKALINQTATIVLLAALLSSCKKDEDTIPAQASINNTNWKAIVIITGTTINQNIFEFANDGKYFSWHPAAVPSYSGTWTQDGTTVKFIFKENTANGDYYWDNTGTLSNNGTILTGTMERRGAQGSGTFTATKL